MGGPGVWANPRFCLGWRLHFRGQGLPPTPQTVCFPLSSCSTCPRGPKDPPRGPHAAPGPWALTEKVVLVTSMLLWEMPPLRLPGMPPLCCFFWLLTMVSMEWLRTRMALCGESRQQEPQRWSLVPPDDPACLTWSADAALGTWTQRHAHPHPQWPPLQSQQFAENCHIFHPTL